MSEFGGFFNSVNGDRKYKSEDFANYFKTFIGNGINPSKDSLRVIKKSNNQVGIMVGSACINGYLYLNSTELTKSISINVTRIDRVVIGLDIINRTLSVYVLQGTVSAPPVLTRNNSKYELSLAKIKIQGSTVNIEDERGQKEICGYMDFLGKDDLQNMWDLFNSQWAEYKELWQDWFVNMQGKSIRGIYIQNTRPAGSKVGDIWIEVP
ncbi:hypothetical protein [Clostridium gasigenes]|uniref:Uncharacterized protein n=1 Tax=Clostridium gasigenes TaxID=94869 RepID=A0A1H0M8V6_9CLOT|nr:hypothetical protein [Clostridium gasigenes]SDO76731.1 hypothetical protein SAMN04488529_101363 [Clostridium gasigenes]